MPFALLIVGLLLLIAGVRNTQDQLFTLAKGDFTGPDNFIYWFVAIIIIGAIGYIPKLKPISTAFLALVIIVLFLKKGNVSGTGGGFFQEFTQALGTTASGAASSSAVPSLSNLANQQAQNTQNLLGAIQSNLAQSEAALNQDLQMGLPKVNAQ